MHDTLPHLLLFLTLCPLLCPHPPVQPHAPENLTVVVLGDKDGTFFRVSWESPRKADTRSGWITLIYELRAKLDGADWEVIYDLWCLICLLS